MKTRAYLYIVVAAVLWGLIGIFVRQLAEAGFTSLQIVALRAITSALVITAIGLHIDPKYFKIAFKDIWMFVGTGVISLTFFNYCYFNCINAGSLAVAALLLYTAPAFVMLMSLVLFKEKFTAIKAAALLGTFLGCGLVTGVFEGNLNLTPMALLFGLGSGIGYALYSIFGKYALAKYKTLTITIYTFYTAAIASIPLADFTNCSAVWSIHVVWASLGLGVLCAVIPYLCYTKGLEAVEPGQASIIATIEPLVAAGIGIFYFAEPATWQKLCGIGLIISAVAVLNLKSSK